MSSSARSFTTRSTSTSTASASSSSRRRFSPSRRSGRTRKPASIRRPIRATAREMARYRPATLIHPGRHSSWYGDDAQRSRAIALLNALMGSWGRKGGLYMPASMDIPAYPHPPYPKPESPTVDNPGNKYPFADESISTGIREATLTGEPYPIKGWLVYATNLIYSLPNQAETIRAIQNLDLLVVVDMIPSEIAGWADVVLPESIYLERYDELHPEPFQQPFIALRQPVVMRRRPEAELVDRQDTRGEARTGRVLPVERHRGVPCGAAQSRRLQLRRPEARRHSSSARNGPIYFEDGAPADVRHAVKEDRVLFARSCRRPASIPCPNTRVQSRRRGLLSAAVWPRPDALLQPYADQSSSHGPDERKLGVGQRDEAHAARPEERRLCAPSQSGR